MKLAVIGTGYVGLVTGTCFAENGNEVRCVDIDEKKIEGLKNGVVPIFEPALSEMVSQNVAAGRLQFSTDPKASVDGVDFVFLAVGTPTGEDGCVDLSSMWEAVEAIAPSLGSETVVVMKSTVPVGTNAAIFNRLKELTGRDVHVASNPEFLKEGAAVDDFQKPDRVVVGTRDEGVADKLKQLYAPFLQSDKPFLAMTPESAEMTKYVANALLATKISFINQMANLCEAHDADINDVRRGIGHDSRIGFAFLFPGAGYGGSCFPKDIRAFMQTFREAGIDPRILDAVDWVNEKQKQVLHQKIATHFGDELAGKTIAIWGLAFKPRTDDIREAPALVLIDQLLELGATIHVHDPEALANIKNVYTDKLMYFDQPMDAARNADALAIVTEWQDFRTPDFEALKVALRSPVIFDGRNLYDADKLKQLGFVYYSIGRPVVGRED